MKTRIMGALLALVMLLGLTPVIPAFAATDEEALNVGNFHEGLEMAEAADKAVLSINYSDLSGLSGMAKEIVDSGTILLMCMV